MRPKKVRLLANNERAHPKRDGSYFAVSAPSVFDYEIIATVSSLKVFLRINLCDEILPGWRGDCAVQSGRPQINPMTSLFACVFCVLETTQEAFPPALWWSFIVLGWFVGLCIFTRVTRVELQGIPVLWKGLLLAVLVVGLGAVGLGPFAFIPLGIACLFGVSALHGAGAELHGGDRTAARIMTLMGVVALGVSALATYLLANAPATAETVLRRELSLWGVRSEFRKLERYGTAALPVYRELLRRTRSISVFQRSLNGVTKIGNPASEVPGLLNLLEELEKERRNGEARILEDELRRFSGFQAERGSGSAGWKEAWHGQQSVNSTNLLSVPPRGILP